MTSVDRSSLDACLARVPAGSIDTVVHLGAGDGASLRLVGPLGARRAVLVEGDADRAAQLQERSVAVDGVEVHAAVVAPRAGPTRWRRFNVHAFDGLLEPGRLLDYYPRLRAIGTSPVDAVGLAELLMAFGLGDAPAAGRLLVVDLPGQEHELLAALSDEALHAFGWLAIRSGREALLVGGCSGAEALQALAERGYLRDHTDDSTEPLWPARLLRLDPELARRLGDERQTNTLAALNQKLQEAERALEGARAATRRAAGMRRLRENDLAELQRRYEELLKAAAKPPPSGDGPAAKPTADE